MTGTSINVEVYPHKIRIVNPGRLLEPLQNEDLGTKIISARRNDIIADLFGRMQIVERVGTGLKRMQEQLAKSGNKIAIFNDMDNPHFFEIEIERPEEFRQVQSEETHFVQKTTQKTTQKIINALKEHPKISRKELAEFLGNITEDGVKYHLNKLQKNGTIKREGPDKGGHWIIKKNE